jgi:hypothetical protein
MRQVESKVYGGIFSYFCQSSNSDREEDGSLKNKTAGHCLTEPREKLLLQGNVENKRDRL